MMFRGGTHLRGRRWPPLGPAEVVRRRFLRVRQPHVLVTRNELGAKLDLMRFGTRNHRFSAPRFFFCLTYAAPLRATR